MKSKSGKTSNPDGSMSVSGHLKELRNRIIVIILVLVVGIVVAFAFADPIVNMLTDMGTKYDYHFVYIKPQELLMVYVTLSLIASAVVTFPVTAYEIYAFMSPGLKKKEKNFIALSIIFGMFFFCIGVFFAYKILLPFMLSFLIQFTNSVSVSASISIQEYISFVLLIFVIMGSVFELPVVTVLLTLLGIIKPEWLVKIRKVMIVATFFLAAVITPPDIISQIMVAIPMIMLNELSIFLSKVFYKLKHKNDDEDDDDDDEDEDDED